MSEQQAVPMLHVPDVKASIAWFQSVGFTVLSTYEDDCELSFAVLAYGNSQIFLNAGGHASEADRRDVDIYIRTDNVEELYARLKDRVEVRFPLDDTFYGTREFAVRDPNHFWIVFGQRLAAKT